MAKHSSQNWFDRHAWATEEQLESFMDSDLNRSYSMYHQNQLALERVQKQFGQTQELSVPFYYTPEHKAFPIFGWMAA